MKLLSVSPLAALLLSLLSTQPSRAVNVTNGLIHLWSFDESGGSTTADSIGSWGLQTVNGATLGVPGFTGTGVRLDGTNDFLTSVPVAADFLNADYTLSLRLRFISVSGKPGILEFRENSRSSYNPHLIVTLGYSPLSPYLSSSGPNTANSVPINDGLWHLLSVVRQGDSASLYLDNTVISSGYGFFTPAGTDIFTLGKDDGSHFFGGLIDDVAIYNRALSASEIAVNVAPEPGTLALLIGTVGAAAASRSRGRKAGGFSAPPQ